MSEEQRRFEEDYEIWKELPIIHKIAIGDAFRALINLALKLLGLQRPAEPPPSHQLSNPEPPRKAQ